MATKAEDLQDCNQREEADFLLLANIIKVPSRRLLKERKTASGDEPRRIR